MRICLVSRELDPFFGAGIGVYVSSSARAWVDAGHEAHVVTQGHAALAERAGRVLPGVIVHAVEAEGREDLPFCYLRHALGVSHVLGCLHKQHPFDYIEFPDYFAEGAFALHGRRRGWGKDRLPGAVLGMRLHTPSIECWDINEERELLAESAAMGPLEYRAIAAADVLVSPSQALLARVGGRLGERGLRKPRGEVVAYPFEADAGVAKGQNPVEDGERRSVLCFGRLERRKGVHVLAEAAVQLLESGCDADFVLVGGDTSTGPGQTSMCEHIESIVPDRWRSRVSVEPAMTREAVLSRVRGCTLCCFPALWDNYPNALLEAMAMGKAIVATEGSGIGEIIEGGQSGLLVEPRDSGALAGALARGLGDDGLRAKLGDAARARVLGLCDPARVIRQMEELISGARVSMRREFRPWGELAPARESRHVFRRMASAIKRSKSYRNQGAHK